LCSACRHLRLQFELVSVNFTPWAQSQEAARTPRVIESHSLLAVPLYSFHKQKGRAGTPMPRYPFVVCVADSRPIWLPCPKPPETTPNQPEWPTEILSQKLCCPECGHTFLYTERHVQWELIPLHALKRSTLIDEVVLDKTSEALRTQFQPLLHQLETAAGKEGAPENERTAILREIVEKLSSLHRP